MNYENYDPFGDEKLPEPTGELAELLEIWARRINRSTTAIRSLHVHQMDDSLAFHGFEWCKKAMGNKRFEHLGSPAWVFAKQAAYDLDHPVDTSKERTAEIRKSLEEQAKND